MSLPVHLASEQFLLKTQKYTNISQHLFTAKKGKRKKRHFKYHQNDINLLVYKILLSRFDTRSLTQVSVEFFRTHQGQRISMRLVGDNHPDV